MIKEQSLISIMEISMFLVFISFIFYLSLGIYTKIRFIFYPIFLHACIKILATSIAITSALYSSRLDKTAIVSLK